MNPIKIDLEELIMAMETSNDDMAVCFFNKKNGEVVSFNRNCDDEKEIEDAYDNDGYICIGRFPSNEAYKIMEDFILKLLDGKMKDLLSLAISKRRPFFNFKETLSEDMQLREQWFEFHKEAMKGAAEKWLVDEGLEDKYILE